LKKYKADIYIGQVNLEHKTRRKRHYFLIHGRRYEGDWLKDLRQERGYEIIYVGRFLEGKS
jgi:hypothetical protein